MKRQTLKNNCFYIFPRSINCHFINLYKILVQSNQLELSWKVIQTIEKLIERKKEWLKKLATEFRFPTILTKLLLGLQDKQKITKLLHLINLLTFEKASEKHIQEPYLDALIDNLLGFINQGNTNPEIPKLSLSVLVNICYKNEEASCMLTKKLDPSKFVKQIKQYGIIASRAFFICEGMCTLKAEDVYHFLTLIFEDVKKATE